VIKNINRRDLFGVLASLPFIGKLFDKNERVLTSELRIPDEELIKLPENFMVIPFYKLKATHDITYKDEQKFDDRIPTIHVQNGKIVDIPLKQFETIALIQDRTPYIVFPNDDGTMTRIPLNMENYTLSLTTFTKLNPDEPFGRWQPMNSNDILQARDNKIVLNTFQKIPSEIPPFIKQGKQYV
jgi:hypothetical protein